MIVYTLESDSITVVWEDKVKSYWRRVPFLSWMSWNLSDVVYFFCFLFLIFFLVSDKGHVNLFGKLPG
jgi:hypothetical protein